MSEINKIRSVFPNWPSELDVAKSSGNWVMQAHAFFSAAVVLDEESNSAQETMYTCGERQIRTELLMRRQTYIPSIFCLAFAIELITKAVLVHQGKLDGVSGKDKLPIAHHSLVELARQIDGFVMDQTTVVVLQWASGVVLDGKYPAPKKPSDTKNGVQTTVSFRELLDNAWPVFERLRNICAQSTPSGVG